jgi:uncharacterized protein YlxW (UPF0749 family)
MSNKTKAQLEQEIKDLKGQLESVSKDEQNDKAAQELRSVYESYIRAGFTDEQAWTLVITLVSNATQKRSIF